MGYGTSGTTDEESCVNRAGEYSRRRILGASGAALASATAGCSSLGLGGSQSGSPASESDVFTDLSFEGQQLVVELQEGHSVERLNLFSPEGSRYTTAAVSPGETRALLQVLRLSSGPARHYSPGKHRLVAVTEGNPVETQVSFQPSLEFLRLEPGTNMDGNASGNILAQVKNTGNAPTWVYSIFYREVPNRDARDSTGSEGNPTLVLKRPSEEEEAILAPGESQKFLGEAAPLIFSEKPECQGRKLRGRVLVKSPALEPVGADFSANLSGEAVVTGSEAFSKSYTCGDVSVEKSQRVGTDG